MDTNVITKDTKGSKDILGTAQHFDASDNHLELSKAARKFNKRNDRALARKLRCLVAVSKLDRLSRDLHFISKAACRSIRTTSNFSASAN